MQADPRALRRFKRDLEDALKAHWGIMGVTAPNGRKLGELTTPEIQALAEALDRLEVVDAPHQRQDPSCCRPT